MHASVTPVLSESNYSTAERHQLFKVLSFSVGLRQSGRSPNWPSLSVRQAVERHAQNITEPRHRWVAATVRVEGSDSSVKTLPQHNCDLGREMTEWIPLIIPYSSGYTHSSSPPWRTWQLFTATPSILRFTKCPEVALTVNAWKESL